jgi:hypothetical protein
MENMFVRLTLTDDILGSLPGDSEVYRAYIASKAPDAKNIEDEIAALGEQEVYEKAVTIFAKDAENKPFLFDYVIKGFFKNACKAMREVSDSKSKGLAAYKSKIDNLVFVGPRQIRLNMPEGSEITICERPLRASTAQGERTALAASEMIPKGTTLDFMVTCLTKDMLGRIPEWLDYGKFNGLGQWHNAGKGRFVWDNLDKDGNIIPGGNNTHEKEASAN